MNRLFYNRVYLSGPIDNAKDFGTGWRNDTKDTLDGLDLIFLDPCAKPMLAGFACEDLENHQRRIDQKKRGDFETISRDMRLIRCIDLRLADLCDFAIVHLDLNVYSTGTHEEVTTLNRRKVPILVHVEQGKEFLPDWYLGALPHQHVFSEWSALFAYIRNVAYAPPPIDSFNRWRFLDYGGLYKMTEIPLTQNLQASISPEDYRHLMQWSWHAAKKGKKTIGYFAERVAGGKGGRKKINMQQEVARRMGLEIPAGHIVDHINGDTLDNRRENLRLITDSQNQCSRRNRARCDVVRGVCYNEANKTHKAAIWKQGHIVWQKHFPTLKEAADEVELVREGTHGDFARHQ
jgi:hypothetical protein